MKRLPDQELLQDSNLRILQKCSLFSNMSVTNIPFVLSSLKAEARFYEKGEFLIHEGSPAQYIGITLNGYVHIISEDYQGVRSIIGTMEPSMVFAESFALAQSAYLPVSIVAGSDCTVLLLEAKQVFDQHGNNELDNLLIRNLLLTVSKKNTILNERLRNTTHKTTREKLLAYLSSESKRQKSDSFTIPYDRQGLADYLGVDRSAMSSEISKLKKEGILETTRSRFRLLQHQRTDNESATSKK